MITASLSIEKTSDFALNSGPKPNRYPVETVQFIKEQNIPGPMLNEYSDGGYLIWNLYPDNKVFIDGRTPNVYSSEFYWYWRHISNDNIFNVMDKKYDFNMTLFKNNSKVSIKLRDSENWKLILFDNRDSLFVKNSEKNKDLIDKYSYKILNPNLSESDYMSICQKQDEKELLLKELKQHIEQIDSPIFSLRVLASIYLNCSNSSPDNWKESEKIANELIEYTIDDASDFVLLGNAQIKNDNDEMAVESFKNSVKLQKNATNMTGLGIALYNVGEYKKAEKVFQEVPIIGGKIPNEFYQIYGRVSYQLDKNERAIELFHKYIDLINEEKITSQDYKDLSNSYLDNNEFSNAAKYSEKARSLMTDS